MSSGSKEWADDQLKYAIRELRTAAAEKDSFHWEKAFLRAFFIKDRLLEYGHVWHVRTLEHWMRSYQKPRGPLLI